VLTVATAFVPAPGFWNDRAGTAGFEAAPAGELAHRLGRVLALRRAQASGVKAIVDDQIRPAVNVAR